MSTPNDNDNDKFAKSAKQLFDNSVESLDAATLSKLNQGRQAALAEISTSTRAQRWLRWTPVTGLAAAAIVAVVMMRGPIVPPETPSAVDFEILIGDDSLEMIEELEFYSWMDMAETESSDNVS